MATKAQTKANRKNAKKSTGPKTAEGKKTASQNAVKHGLFADQITIHGEDRGEFDLFREAFLAEYRPIGMTESVLAERIVSLSWRLRRAERMESEVIDHLIICTGSDRPDTFTILNIPLEDRKVMVQDGGVLLRDLTMGQAIVRDFTHYQVLDRLMLYERRMESSLHKTITLLKKLQLMRIIEQADAAKRRLAQETAQARTQKSNLKKQSQSPASGGKPETRSWRSELADLKKQSQLAAERMGITSCAQEDYDGQPPVGARENKANQSQLDEPTQKGAGEKRKTERAIRPITG